MYVCFRVTLLSFPRSSLLSQSPFSSTPTIIPSTSMCHYFESPARFKSYTKHHIVAERTYSLCSNPRPRPRSTERFCSDATKIVATCGSTSRPGSCPTCANPRKTVIVVRTVRLDIIFVVHSRAYFSLDIRSIDNNNSGTTMVINLGFFLVVFCVVFD